MQLITNRFALAQYSPLELARGANYEQLYRIGPSEMVNSGFQGQRLQIQAVNDIWQ